MSTEPMLSAVDRVEVTLEINGRSVTRTVPARQLLVDFIRDDLGLTGTHVGCEHGVCGACTVQFDGSPVRSCIMLAAQAEGATITTIEGITPDDGLSALQEAFKEHHGLQCGFCTPGIIMTLAGADEADYPGDDGIREALSGNLCRCTGYAGIVRAVRSAWGRGDE